MKTRSCFLAFGMATALGIALSLAAGTAIAEEKKAEAVKAEAKKHFEKGVSLFKNDDFEGALVEFKAAYEVKPHYAVRYNLGICLFKLHRYAEAAEEMTAYLTEGGASLPADKKKEIEAYLAELESLVGYVEFEGGVEGAHVLVDGKQMITLPQGEPLMLNVGEYAIEIHAEGFETWEKTLSLPGGGKKTIEVLLVPMAKPAEKPAVAVEKPVEKPVLGAAKPAVEPTGKPAGKPAAEAGAKAGAKPGKVAGKGGAKDGGKKKIRPGLFWTGFCLTLASAALATTAGAIGLNHEKQYAKLDYDDEWQPMQAEINRDQLVANILWPVAGAFAIATLVTAFFTDFKKRKESPGGKDKVVKKAEIWISPDPAAPAFGFTLEM